MNKLFYRSGLIALALISTIEILAADEGSRVVEIEINIPKVPEVPSVEAVVPKAPTNVYIVKTGDYKTNDEIVRDATTKKVIYFSDHVAPVYEEKKDDANKVVEVGDIHNGNVPAYLQTKLIAVADVKAALQKAGFDIEATYRIDKKGSATAILFTNDALIKNASKADRGFAATLRVTVDKKDGITSITNPIYLLAAFMQDEYTQALAEETLNSLRVAFPALENSQEELKFRIMDHYQFMQGMPKYGDMIVIKKASNADLLKSIRKSKKIVYEQELLNGSVLLGVKLSKRTSKFVKKIGYKNSGLLPYAVLIEGGEVKILDPKYYIAVMYPMLKMSQFMTIATVPGAIEKEIDKMFRK